MKPREIRRYILTDHTFLKGLLDELDRKALRVLEGWDEELPVLRDYGLSFHAKFVEHLAFEDRFLAPALRAAGGSGVDQAESLADEHREQRELLDYILSGLRDRSRPGRVVANEMRSLVELILDDIAQEEMAIIRCAVLRDPDLRPGSDHVSNGSGPSTSQ
jgi:hypothetical protein